MAASADRAARAGGRWLTDTSHFPLIFEGRQINDHTALIVRLSVGHDAFIAGAPAAGGSDWPKQKATMRGIVPVPTEGRVRHVDVFLSYNGEPYWPAEDTIRAARSPKRSRKSMSYGKSSRRAERNGSAAGCRINSEFRGKSFRQLSRS